jgi:hypothetical protein
MTSRQFVDLIPGDLALIPAWEKAAGILYLTHADFTDYLGFGH